MSSMKKYLLLFDIDGTLVRLNTGVAAPIFANAIKQVIGINIELHPTLSFAGRTDYGILQEILRHNDYSENISREKIGEIYNLIYQDFQKLLSSDTIKILPGVKDLLELLYIDDRFILGILTGNFEKNAILKIEFFNLQHYFKFGVFGDFAIDRNDLPLQALRLANTSTNLHFTAQQCLVIGDTQIDILSAKQSNMRSLAVATGILDKSQLAEHSPDLLFENFSDYHNVYNSILNLFNQK